MGESQTYNPFLSPKNVKGTTQIKITSDPREITGKFGPKQAVDVVIGKKTYTWTMNNTTYTFLKNKLKKFRNKTVKIVKVKQNVQGKMMDVIYPKEYVE